jgi:hypothetical protein
LTASGRDEGVGTDHPVHAAIPYIRVIAPPPIIGTRPGRTDWAWRLGTGHVDATCQSLLETRMKCCGARWKEETGQHIVQL